MIEKAWEKGLGMVVTGGGRAQEEQTTEDTENTNHRGHREHGEERSKENHRGHREHGERKPQRARRTQRNTEMGREGTETPGQHLQSARFRGTESGG